MNNFERHEAVEELLVKHTARELAGMVVDMNKIKAEAVREVAEMSFIDDAFTYQMIKAHANKLENQND